MPIVTSILLTATTVGTSVTAARRLRRRRRLEKASKETVLSAEASPELIMPNDNEEAVNHYFAANSLSLAMTMGGVVFHPLMVAGLPLNIYTTLPTLQEALRAWREEQRVNSKTIESALVFGTMATGWWLPSATISWSYSFGRKLKHQLRRDVYSLLEKTAQSPKVWTEFNGTELQVPLEQIENGDTLIMHQNSILPLPGRVTKGEATLNTYLTTQRTEPVEVKVGDLVPPLALVIDGRIYVQVHK